MNEFIPDNPYLLLTQGSLSTGKGVRKAFLQDYCTCDSDYGPIIEDMPGTNFIGLSFSEPLPFQKDALNDQLASSPDISHFAFDRCKTITGSLYRFFGAGLVRAGINSQLLKMDFRLTYIF